MRVGSHEVLPELLSQLSCLMIRGSYHVPPDDNHRPQVAGSYYPETPVE